MHLKKVYPLFIFKTNEFLEINSKNLSTLLLQIVDFIYNIKLKINTKEDFMQLKRFGQAAQLFISFIYKVEQNSLKANNSNRIFRQNIIFKFTPKIINNKPNKRVKTNNKGKQVGVVKVLPSILFRSSKETLEKSKFFQKKDKNSKEDSNIKIRYLYTQTSAPKVKKILKLKKNFLNLLLNKIKNIYNMINNSEKIKPRISMITKGSFRRHIIIPISNDNILNFMKSSSLYITNLNKVFKNIKSEIVAEFVQSDQHEIIITTNKITLLSDLYTIENYIKNTNNIKSNDIIIPYLPQLKPYLKIIGISYLMENTNMPINSSITETIIKNIHIFNNMLSSYELSKHCPNWTW